MPFVKFSLPLAIFAALALCACNTIENRRSLYTTEKVHGPYTRQLNEGTWGNPQTVDEQYAETQAAKRYPKVIPGEKKPEAIPPSNVVAPSEYPVAPLPN